MGELFNEAGFDTVDTKLDLTLSQLRREVRDFAAAAADADIAVVYYAGHGIEVNGANYLIPADARLASDYDIPDETFPLDRILDALEPVKHLRLVILDACRDNPFSKTMKRSVATRSIGRGLAKVEPTTSNTLVAFAAKAGAVASDGDGSNSPFASALMKHITAPGLELRLAFGKVRDDVIKTTANQQEPFVYGSLGGEAIALVPAATGPSGAANSPDEAGSRRDYELALQIGTREAWDYFIAAYPNSFYSNLAKAQRNKLAAEEARLAATEKAKAALDEQTRLGNEGARAAEQAKAAAQAKAAVKAQVAAELAKMAEDAKVAEAEREKNAADTDRKAAGPVAALTPDQTAAKTGTPAADLPFQLQVELRRVGCNIGAVNDTWTPAAQKSMELFNKYAGMKLDVKVASLDSLDVVKSKTARICPLTCEHGYQADGDRCTKISCKAGYEVGDDNTCEKIEEKKAARPVARQERGRASSRRTPEASGSSASGRGTTMDCNGPMGFANCVARNLASGRVH